MDILDMSTLHLILEEKRVKHKIVIAADHGALELKNRLVEHIRKRGDEITDMGVFSEQSIDYPDIVKDAVEEFRSKPYTCGIVCCGTGIGVSMSANKYQGIRCALPQNSYAAAMGKRHNNANFIAFGGRIEYCEPVEEMLDAYLNTEFEGGRHSRRVEKIMKIEE